MLSGLCRCLLQSVALIEMNRAPACIGQYTREELAESEYSSNQCHFADVGTIDNPTLRYHSAGLEGPRESHHKLVPFRLAQRRSRGGLV